MRKLALYFVLLAPAFAALSPNLVIEVRPSVGVSTTGGGWWTGSTGTDLTPWDAKNAAGCTVVASPPGVGCQSATVNISTTDAVAVGSTTITSATANFSAAIVGNVLYFTGGTGSIAAVRRQVATFTNSTTIVLDASIAASTGMTMNIAGSADTIATALAFNTAANTIWVKSTAALTNTADIVLNNNQSPVDFNSLFGYATVRGDHGPVALTLSTNTGLTAINGNGHASGWWVDGFNIDCASLGTSTGVTFNGSSMLTNSKIANCTTRLFYSPSLGNAFYNEFTGCTSACSDTLFLGSGGNMQFNYVHDNVALAVNSAGQQGINFSHNIVDTITGAGHDGIQCDLNCTINFNVFFNVIHDSISLNGSSGHIGLGTSVIGNIVSTSGRYGLIGSGVNLFAQPGFDGNTYYASGTADRKFIDKTPAIYTNIWDIACVTDPFVNAAGGNFTLAATACATASKGTGQPGWVGPKWGKATGTGYMDLGVFQTQFGTGSSGGNFAYSQ